MNSATARPLKIDEIGDWSVLKLEILRQYSYAYSTILTKHNLYHIYIDGFAGAGHHILKTNERVDSRQSLRCPSSTLSYYYPVSMRRDSGTMAVRAGTSDLNSIAARVRAVTDCAVTNRREDIGSNLQPVELEADKSMG